MQGIIFCDIDGTIVFHDKIHGVKVLSKEKVEVEGKEFDAFDLSTEFYNTYMGKKTYDLFKELSKKYYIILVSGARKSSVEIRKEKLDFAHAFVLENGGLIFDKDLNEDKEWSKRFESEVKVLNKFKKELKEWVLDDKGRKTSIRIREKDNIGKGLTEFKESITLPNKLKKTINIGSLDIICKSSGKDSAVKYLMRKLNSKLSFGIGDDLNDLEFLRIVEHKFVLGSSYKKVLDIANKEGWYISKNKYFDGINEILENILFQKLFK